jgi:DNA primase
VLVEGLLDVHQLRGRGFTAVTALGGTSATPAMFERLHRHGINEAILALDNDPPGRHATARAVEAASRATDAPTLRVLDPGALAPEKDPDAYVRRRGIEAFREILDGANCAVTWRALELTNAVTADAKSRRAALARAGEWLGTLPPRLALEQEDAVKTVADRCGYSPEATARAFRARFWRDPEREVARPEQAPSRLAR